MQQTPAPAPTSTTISDRSTQFVATTGGEETTSAEVLLVVAYLVMWLLVFGFIALSFRKLTRLSERIDSLEGSTDAKGDDTGAGS